MVSATDEIGDRLFGTLVGTLEAAAIALGARLRCRDAVADAGVDGISATSLATACGIHPRYAREWLESMGASGLLTVTRDGEVPADRCYVLADGVRDVLLDPDSGAYLTPLLRQAAAALVSLPAIEEAYRSGGGVPWDAHDPDVRAAEGDANHVPLRRHLPGWVRGWLPEAAKRLDRGGRVADIGCGHGWAAVGLAEAFPAAHVDAFDVDAETVAAARRHVESAGVADRVHVHHGGIEAAAPGRYDLMVLAEMLHDVPAPVGLLAAARASLADDGVMLVADMKVAEQYAAPAEPLDRLMYGFSLLICLPDAMTARPTAATGTVMRPATLRRYAAEAGLSATELDIADDFWRFWALRTADTAHLAVDTAVSASGSVKAPA